MHTFLMRAASLWLAGWAAGGIVAAPFNVREMGAVGDGVAVDTAAIQKALDAAGAAGGGEVRLPAGRYLSGTLHLRSGVVLHLDAGARLIGTTNLAAYRQAAPPQEAPEAGWGKWHRALLLGENLQDVTVTGSGVIDGNKVFDPTGEERMRGPHALVFVNCRRFRVRDVTFVDAANYAVYFQVSDGVEFRNVTFVGGWDGVHWRGVPGRWCRNVRITDCQFYTGDDAIAGRYWDDTVIRGCVINSSCNGIRLIGPATRLLVADNLFYGPGREPHRTSGERRRTNMLSGIILQPGAWDATRGLLDDVLLANNTMRGVASPVTLWTKPGNPVGRVVVDGLRAAGVYRSAVSVESWAEEPMTNVVLRNVSVEFDGGGTAAQGQERVRGPGVDARALPAWGLYARRVEQLTLEDVRFSLKSADLRPVVVAEGVERLVLENFRFPRVEGVETPIMTTNVATILERSELGGSEAQPGGAKAKGTTR